MKHFLSASDIENLAERRHEHQFNENAVRMTRSIGAQLGLERLGVHMVRLEPGRDSTTHHYHEADEEFIFILQGNGTARIGNDEKAVGPGDFMAFTAPSEAHSLTNNSDADLVYLVGGESNIPDVVHYPDINRVMFKDGSSKRWVKSTDINPVIDPNT